MKGAIRINIFHIGIEVSGNASNNANKLKS